MNARCAAALVALLAAACGKDSDTTSATAAPSACARYADLEINCGGAGKGARSTIVEFCEKSGSAGSDVTLQYIALEVSCARDAADCAAYKQCVADRKRSTAPKR